MNDYTYRRRIAFHESDPMGVLHHANYIKIFEEARVNWLRDLGLLRHHQPEGDIALAVIQLKTKFLKSVKFDQQVDCRLILNLRGIRLSFYCELLAEEEVCCRALIELAPVGRNLRPMRFPEALQTTLAGLSQELPVF